MTDKAPIVNPKHLTKVHFGKSKCTKCEADEMVFVGIMQAADVIPDTNCEVYQCLHCEYNMVFALLEDEDDDWILRGQVVVLDDYDDDGELTLEFEYQSRYLCPNCASFDLVLAQAADDGNFYICQRCDQSYILDNPIGDDDEQEDEDDGE